METKIRGAKCLGCPFHDESRVVKGFGALPANAKAVIVGEAPGNQEARLGIPFVGPSGNLIRSLLKHVGFMTRTCRQASDESNDIEEIYYTNAIYCYPGTREAAMYKTGKLKKLAAISCKERLLNELEPYIKAGVPICAVGGSSALALTGYDSITKMRGKWFNDNTVLCTWHPAYILRQPSRVGELAMDIRKLFNGLPLYLDFPEVKVIHIDTITKMRSLTKMLIRDCQSGKIPGATVAMDIETGNINWLTDKILCIQISWNVHSGAVIIEDIVYSPEVRDCLIQLFNPSNGVKWVGHNFKFDMRFMRHQLGVHNVHTNYDTLIADYLLDENKNHALKKVLTEMYDLPDYEKDLVLKYLKIKMMTMAKCHVNIYIDMVFWILPILYVCGMIYVTDSNVVACLSSHSCIQSWNHRQHSSTWRFMVCVLNDLRSMNYHHDYVSH